MDDLARLKRALAAHCPATRSTEPHLHAVLTQATENPGKLCRARLVLAAAEAHGLEPGNAERLACAIEYYHIASLLLDDLPCMDDSETRRGLLCAHRLHGEAPAILGSLALINRAYGLIGLALERQPLFVRTKANACLDAALGAEGLVGGQAHDLAFAESDRTARTVGRIAAAKTAALFWLAVYFPALLGSPDAKEARLLRSLCLYWGLAVQTMDDLGDVLKSSEETGKTSGRDAALNRPNIALALGVAEAERRLWRLISLAERTTASLAASRPVWAYLAYFHRKVFGADTVTNRIRLAA